MEAVQKCICVLCQRNVKLIEDTVENKQKPKYNTRANILYIDSYKRVVCGRCVSENTLSLKYSAEAVVVHRAKDGTYEVNSKALATAITVPVSLESEDIFLSTDA
jgi:hypothetical protein